MRKYLFSSPRVLVLGVLIAVLAAVPAQASEHSVDTSECAEGTFSQAFSTFKDSNWYTLLAGQSGQGFEGSGWQLTGGAQIVTTTLPNGSSGPVLDMPSGSSAVSPRTCVTSNYPTARAFVRNVVGGEGVQFSVSYEGSKTWEKPKGTGQIHGQGNAWTPATPVNLQPEQKFAGWQPMRITLTAGGKTSDFQVYSLYLDPRLSH